MYSQKDESVVQCWPTESFPAIQHRKESAWHEGEHFLFDKLSFTANMDEQEKWAGQHHPQWHRTYTE
jgi:hypothetical protein